MFDHGIDACCQCDHVVGIDGREHAHAQLIATKFAVAVCVDDAVGAKDRIDLIRIDPVKIDRADNV